MTTETPAGARASVLPVRSAAAATTAAGSVAVVLGALLDGRPAGLAAAAGAVLVLVVLGAGSLVVAVVAGVLPSASLLVALLTYTLQVLAMGVLFAALSGSGLLDGSLDREWLGGTAIGCVVVWLLAQVLGTTRARIPAFDPQPLGGPAHAPAQGGDR